MNFIIVSACLLGRKVRYDGADKKLENDILSRWRAEERVVAVCPEVAAGLEIPRPATEIKSGAGADVLAGRAQVFDITGRDVTQAYVSGAEIALAHAKMHNIKFALLIDGSPSCGYSFIYDGSFNKTKVHGVGVMAALLRENGIAVYAPADIEVMAEHIKIQENASLI